MKLFARYNRINIAVTIGIFLLGAVAFYFVLHYILLRQLDETLRSEQQEIQNYVHEHDRLPEIENTKRQWILVDTMVIPASHTGFRTTSFYNRREEEWEWTRQLVFLLRAGGRYYTVTVNKSGMETEDLLQLVVPVVLSIVGLLLLANVVINRKLVGRLWQPFYHTIRQLKAYRLSDQPPPALPPGSIDELALLNETLNEMTTRIYRDYQVLKDFTGNAAHEMQTPLAVIRSKVDILLEYPGWDKKNLQQLQSIEEATNKLARLHQSLLLLSRIENQQFPGNEELPFHEIVAEKYAERVEWLKDRDIRVEMDGRPVTLRFHRHLSEILVSNLLHNAARYTPPGGLVQIRFDEDRFMVRNTAANGPLDTGKVFQRFYKADHTCEGTGLGLAIVKEISHLAGFTTGYRFEEGMHVFVVNFGH